jgi:hypothetical protein
MACELPCRHFSSMNRILDECRFWTSEVGRACCTAALLLWCWQLGSAPTPSTPNSRDYDVAYLKHLLHVPDGSIGACCLHNVCAGIKALDKQLHHGGGRERNSACAEDRLQ